MSTLGRQTKAAVVGGFRRAQILEAARTSFARCGLPRTTVSHIARTARVAKGTIYRYYRSKDEILRELLAEDLSALHDETVPVITGPGAIQDKLPRFVRGMLEFFDRNRDFIEQCHLGMTVEMRRKARRRLERTFAAQTQAWEAAIAAAVRTGAVDARDAHQTAVGIVSLAYGLAMQRLKGWTSGPIERDVADAGALLWKGLSPR
jgi:AcrR family transcriptional regulator